MRERLKRRTQPPSLGVLTRSSTASGSSRWARRCTERSAGLSLEEGQNGLAGNSEAHAGQGSPGYDFAKVRVYPPEPRGHQPKLAVSQPGDAHEQEAERLADDVMRMARSETNPMLDPPPARRSSSGCVGCDGKASRQLLDEESTEPVADTEALFPPDQLDQDEKEESELEQQRLMPKPLAPGAATRATPDVSMLLGRSPEGTSLPSQVRAFMELGFGRNFGAVRIHTDRSAAQLCRLLGAKAFTLSRDVYFGAGWYRPGTFDGLHLMAHELAHVAQQERAVPSGSVNRSVIQRACQEFPGHTDPDTYCETRPEAEARITRACPPYRDDFLYRDGPPTHRWRPIPGYGCAHHAAHILGISVGPRYARCHGGFSVTIDQITQGRTAFPLAQAQVNDVWSTGVHSGVVRQVDAIGSRVRVDQCGVGGTASEYWTTNGQAYR